MKKEVDPKAVSVRLVQRMKDLDISGADITRATGASSAAITKWRQGINAPTRYILPLSQLLQCTPEWLLHGEEPRSVAQRAILPVAAVDAPDVAPQSVAEENIPALVTPIAQSTGYGDVPTPLHKPESNIGSPGRYRTWSSNDPLPPDEFIYLRYKKEVAFRGGDGSIEMEDYNDYKLPFARATMYRMGITPERAMCFTVEGDSMEPVLPPGAMIGVNFDDTRIKDGEIYAFRHDDLFRVKILYRLPGGKVKISSYNSMEYPDEFVSIEDIIIIGRVFTWSVLN